MSDFINTVDVIGEDELIDQIIQRTITEFKDDRIHSVGNNAFYSCPLTAVDLRSATLLTASAFNSCTALETVNCPKVEEIASESSSGSGVFADCTSLKKADFASLTSLGGRAFFNCTALSALILRGDTLCNLVNTTAVASSGIGKGAGYVYVPSALLADYQAATNWSTYAAQFRALEDYTVDGTIDGELDESKI